MRGKPADHNGQKIPENHFLALAKAIEIWEKYDNDEDSMRSYNEVYSAAYKHCDDEDRSSYAHAVAAKVAHYVAESTADTCCE